MTNETKLSKAYETARRATDMKIFRKSCMNMTIDELDILSDHFADKKAKCSNHVQLLKGVYLIGKLPEKRFNVLAALYPNVARIGFTTIEETKTGKLREVHINPNAIKMQSPDTDFQLLKVLNASTMPEKLKNDLIEAETAMKRTHEHALQVAASTSSDTIDKKEALMSYERAKLLLDQVITEVERNSGIITLAKTSAEKLLEIVTEDLNGRILKDQSVMSECTSKLQWIDSVQAWRRRDAVTVEFINICKELGIEAIVPESPKLHKKQIKALTYGAKSVQGMKERERIAAENKKAKEAKKPKTATAEPVPVPVHA